MDQQVFLAMEEQLGKLVKQVEVMNTKIDALSARLEDHVNKCGQQQGTQHQASEHVEESKEETKSDQTKRRYRCSKEENQEESMRMALKEHIVLLVENVSFAATSLQDRLIADNCLSENESQEIRKQLNEKDQMRNVVRLLRGRSFEVMNLFLKYLNEDSSHVADKIRSTYEKRIREYNHKSECVYCKLKCSVDLKFLADHVWSIGALSDLAYNEIVSGMRGLKELWTLFAQECNSGERVLEVIGKIADALRERGFYKDLASKVKTLTELKCSCHCLCYTGPNDNGHQTRLVLKTDIDISSMASTASPKSSVCTENDDVSRNSSDVESEEESIGSLHLGRLNSLQRFMPLDTLRLPLASSRTDDACYRQFYGVSKGSKAPCEEPVQHSYDFPSSSRSGRRSSSIY